MVLNENEKYIVLDIESTNSVDDPIAYDVGFAVFNYDGSLVEAHSYVVADIFLDRQLMESAYFADKIPQYWEDIKSGKRILQRFKTIRAIFADVVRQYNIRIVVAHNSRFDYRGLNLTQRYLTCSKYRYFFPYGIEIWDSLKMARNTFKNNDEYGAFCYEHDFMTKRNQRRYTAEILYKFLTSNLDFEESHTGLEDVLIENEIFQHCLQANPDFSGRLWEQSHGGPGVLCNVTT